MLFFDQPATCRRGGRCCGRGRPAPGFQHGPPALAGAAVFFLVAVVFWISVARSGGQIKVREIAGLKAIEEAVGRATEMGRSVLFVPGIQDVSEIQITGIAVLSKWPKYGTTPRWKCRWHELW